MRTASRAAAKCTAKVDFPTPPFHCTIVIIAMPIMYIK
jgi:hypothetical protein